MDLFKDIIPRINRGETAWLDELSDKEIKRIPWKIVLRAMSCGNGKDAAISTLLANEVANRGFYALYKHPKLQAKLLAMCADNKKYKPYFKYAKEHNKILNYVMKCYPLWKKDEATMFVDLASDEELINLAYDFGMQEKDLKEWIKEVKKR